MGLRVQLERQQKALYPSIREYARFFAIDEKTLKLAKTGCDSDAPRALQSWCGKCLPVSTMVHNL